LVAADGNNPLKMLTAISYESMFRVGCCILKGICFEPGFLCGILPWDHAKSPIALYADQNTLNLL